ncbi:MAG TPA: type IV pili twitching motility protein PilT [Syntrophomonas sp.]|jgi:twitching motility protein PilT|nr:type IV pili twitching motility protein PilT [Syntrophomonas sp.]
MELNEILKTAVDRGASDVHLSPLTPPIIRFNTRLIELNDTVLEKEELEQMALGILGDKAHRVFMVEGEIDTSYRIEGVGNFRVNIYRHQGMVAIAARIIQTKIPDLEYLGLPVTIASLARYSSGLILITGPTGNGKSTTMASMIDIINSERACHIVTLEDPVEYIHQNKKSYITQREMGIDSKDFAQALRASLRQDPDVIMIGELRDLETISTAITAAETGHLVLATLHTINAAQTVERMIDVFPSTHQQQVRIQLSNCLRAVISQRLLPNITNERMVVATELMICTNAIRNLIREAKYHQIPNAIFTGSQFGMLTMEMSLQYLIDQEMIDAGFQQYEKGDDAPILETLAYGSVPLVKPSRSAFQKQFSL